MNEYGPFEENRPAPVGEELIRSIEENIAASLSLQVRLPWLEDMLLGRLKSAMRLVSPARFEQMELSLGS